MIVIRSLTAAGLALGGAAFWFAVTDAPSTMALPPLAPPMVARSVQLADVSFPLVDPACTDPLCVMSGGSGAATPPRLTSALLAPSTQPLPRAVGTDPLAGVVRV